MLLFSIPFSHRTGHPLLNNHPDYDVLYMSYGTKKGLNKE